jgi:hypothetical protein
MAEVYGPAPPINLPTLLPQITRYCFSGGQTADLALNTQFVNARYRAHQMVRLMEFSSTELDLNFSIRSVTRVFNITHCAVKRALLRGYEDRPGRGRHRELSPEEEHALVKWIAKKAHNNTTVTRTESLNYCIGLLERRSQEDGLIHFCPVRPQNFLKRKFPSGKIKT